LSSALDAAPFYQCQSLATPEDFRHINHIVNADAIAFQLNAAKWLMVKLPSGCAIAATGENHDEDCGNK